MAINKLYRQLSKTLLFNKINIGILHFFLYVYYFYFVEQSQSTFDFYNWTMVICF